MLLLTERSEWSWQGLQGIQTYALYTTTRITLWREIKYMQNNIQITMLTIWQHWIWESVNEVLGQTLCILIHTVTQKITDPKRKRNKSAAVCSLKEKLLKSNELCIPHRASPPSSIAPPHVTSNVVIDIDCWEADSSSGRGHRLSAGPDNPQLNCSPLLPQNTVLSLYPTLPLCLRVLFLSLASIQSFTVLTFHLPSSLCPSLSPRSYTMIKLACPHADLGGFFLNVSIARTEKRDFRKKMDISSFLPSSSSTHPCFHLQHRAGSRSWPDSRGGFHVTETSAKGSEWYSLHFLLIAHCSTVTHFPDSRWRRRWLAAKAQLHPEDPLPICNIYQLRWNPFCGSSIF